MVTKAAGNPGRVRILFQPCGRRGWVPEGVTVLEAARLLGVGIEAACSGCQTCGKCKVKIIEGFVEREEILSSPAHCLPPSEEELECLSPAEISSGYRLACASVVAGDLAVFVPEESQALAQIVRKEASAVALEIAPAVECVFGTIPAQARPEEPLRARLGRARLSEGGSAGSLYFHDSALRELSGKLGGEGAQARFVVAEVGEVVRVDLPSESRRRTLGLAVDLGTTTIVGLLCDLQSGDLLAHHSMMNPQIQFGEDVLARISFAAGASPAGGEPSSDNRMLLAQAARDALNTLLRETCRAAGCDPSEVVEMTVVGNPTMHHLAIGLDPTPLGRNPYQPVVTGPLSIYANLLGLEMLSCGLVHFLPLRAGYIGADTIAGILACDLEDRPGVTLFMDVGTNGEIVLATPSGLLAAACATGPAFEGAHISAGMRAAEGAIERVRIDPESWEVEVKVIGESGWGAQRVKARGICGSGIVDAVAEMVRCGVLNKTGSFTKERKHPRLIGSGAERSFVLVEEARSATGQAIAVTAKDVRAVQVGKAALYAGAKLLMERAGVCQVDRILLAGAFGSYIDPLSALRIGMLPDCSVEDVVAVGNAAGEGARRALLDRKARERATRLRDEVGYVELTLEDGFTRAFAEAMHLPHMSGRFERFEESVGRLAWRRRVGAGGIRLARPGECRVRGG